MTGVGTNTIGSAIGVLGKSDSAIGWDFFAAGAGTNQAGGNYTLAGGFWSGGTTVITCPEDLDGDGIVAFGDLLAILAAWGHCEGCDEDLDGDDAVGFGDLLLVLAAWGPCE